MFIRLLLGALFFGCPDGLAKQVGFFRIDQDVGLQGRSAQQHSEFHGIAVGQGHFDIPFHIAQADLRQYYIALFLMSTRVRDPSLIDNFRSSTTRGGS